MEGYQGILFPERAEDLRQDTYASYRVFLEYWDALSEKLRLRYESLATRKASSAVIVFGPQGSGKTLLADTLVDGHKRATEHPDEPPSASNLWHRITGGRGLNPTLVRAASTSTAIHHIEDDENWLTEAITWHKSNTGRHRIIIADNAERAYFRQSLLGVTRETYLASGTGENGARIAAERFVSACRTSLRPALFIFLTNDETFALEFAAAVNNQHRDLVALEVLPFPSDRDKEVAVRVNINRLNRISYWYCLDRAGPESKRKVWAALKGEETFPVSFSAVNEAIATADRTGRPANACLLSLVVMSNVDTPSGIVAASLGLRWDKRSWSGDGLRVDTFTEGWASSALSDKRQVKLLESEWNLRLISVGSKLSAALLRDATGRAAFARVFAHLETFHGVGTRDATLQDYWHELERLLKEVPPMAQSDELAEFWSKGQVRSHDYERALREIMPAYDRGADGFLNYRPDYVVETYTPCSVLDSNSQERDAINEAIRRKAHVFEFTALKDYTVEGVRGYLAQKLPNYVAVLEQ